MAIYSFKGENLIHTNLTQQHFLSLENLKSTPEYMEWIEDNEDGTLEEYQQAEQYWNSADQYEVQWNEWHLLQFPSNITKEQILLVHKYCSETVLIDVTAIEANAIGLSSSGSDYSASIELAYLIVDLFSPFEAPLVDIGITEEGNHLLLELREMKIVDRRAKIYKLGLEL